MKGANPKTSSLTFVTGIGTPNSFKNPINILKPSARSAPPPSHCRVARPCLAYSSSSTNWSLILTNGVRPIWISLRPINALMARFRSSMALVSHSSSFNNIFLMISNDSMVVTSSATHTANPSASKRLRGIVASCFSRSRIRKVFMQTAQSFNGGNSPFNVRSMKRESYRMR